MTDSRRREVGGEGEEARERGEGLDHRQVQRHHLCSGKWFLFHVIYYKFGSRWGGRAAARDSIIVRYSDTTIVRGNMF